MRTPNPRSIWSDCGEAPRACAATLRPLVVALHASGSSSRQWQALAARLEPPGGSTPQLELDLDRDINAEPGPARSAKPHPAPGCRVLAVDLHDHGVGPAWTTDGVSPAPLTLEDEAALVAPLLAEAGRVGQGEGDGGGVHLVGHSYGGAVALKVASQHPQHVRSLVLYEPVAFRLLLDDPASHAETAEALAVTHMVQTHLERGDIDGAARHFVDYWSGVGTWAAMPAPARAAVAQRMPIVLQHFGALLNERQQVAALARLAVPTLVLSGEHTVATARRIAQRLRSLLPHAVHETLAGMGHMGPLTHAAVVAERIAMHLGVPRQRAAAPSLSPAPELRPRVLSTVD